MKKLITCVALLVSSYTAAPAMAADMPMKAPTNVAAAPSWTGFYAGVNGGFGGDQFEYPFSLGAPAAISGSLELNSSGFFGGGQIGYNWQISPTWVAGVEADLQGADIDGRLNATINVLGIGLSADAGSKLDYFGTVRGRLGYLVTPNLLVYGTGGWAYGRTTASLNVAGLLTASVKNDRSGWAAGGGFEYAFANNWSLKTEYIYMDLGTETLASGGLLGIPASLEEKATFHTIKAGLNYRFGAL